MPDPTPGPWQWREDEFREKYQQRLRNGTWRARPGHRSDMAWVYLLTGPAHGLVAPQYRDEFDYPHIMSLRWGSVRGSTLLNAAPSEANGRLIAAAPDMFAALVRALAALREAPLVDAEVIASVRAALDLARNGRK